MIFEKTWINSGKNLDSSSFRFLRNLVLDQTRTFLREKIKDFLIYLVEIIG